MIYILNPYYVNLFLLLVIAIAVKVAYDSRCNYSNLVATMNKISLTEIGLPNSA